MKFSQIEAITGGKRISSGFEDEIFTTLVTDSRKAGDGKGAVFFAIRGERHDGHQYLRDLFNKGFRYFIVEVFSEPLFPEWRSCGIVLVNSSVKALQDIAGWHRRNFPIPVIGITGSNGKTIIKEWLFQLLCKKENIVKNPGSYNSQIGVPLSVWQISPRHTLGIFEAGISRKAEMENLCRVMAPTIGLFTTIGPAHDEGFSSRREKIREKLKLFDSAEILLYCRDHDLLDEEIRNSAYKTFSWSLSGRDADILITREGNTWSVIMRKERFSLSLPFTDKASVENCFHCVALMLHLGYTPWEIQEGIDTLRSVPMRLELKEGINQCFIIDDTYNNDLGGLEISLQFLAHQHQRKKKTVILSDVLESGLSDEDLTEKIASLVSKSGAERLIGIGPVLQSGAGRFGANSLFYPTTAEFIKNFSPDLFSGEVILVKGARPFSFEDIVRLLQRKVHGTRIEIDLGALVHNLNLIRARLKKDTRIMVMVKAFAYGSGSNEIANLLQYHRVDYLGVAYADEGVELRKNNITLPVMVMNPTAESFEQLLQYKLEPEIYSFKILNSFLSFIGSRPAQIHLKIDTGMHRLGFEEDETDTLAAVLKQYPEVRIASVFSHLAGADDPAHDAFSRQQVALFLTCANRIAAAIGYRPMFHILNSPGILRLPEYQFDMVRLGIGLYGIDPTGKSEEPVKPVASLKTIISQIKRIRKGDTIGYGRYGVAADDMTIATIAIGYADGFSRAFSRGRGRVLINGKLAPVIGNVCMDMTMVDISGIEANEGDEVLVFGKDLPIQDVARSIDTIPYEILTNTSERVKRVFLAESI